MPELYAVHPSASAPHQARALPLPPPPPVGETETGDTTRNRTGAERQGSAELPVRERLQARLRDRDDIPTGPPPAFQASLLEVEGQLDRLIQRIEAARARARDDEATRTGGAAPGQLPQTPDAAAPPPDIRPAAAGPDPFTARARDLPGS